MLDPERHRNQTLDSLPAWCIRIWSISQYAVSELESTFFVHEIVQIMQVYTLSDYY
jgi:hypothetical protein